MNDLQLLIDEYLATRRALGAKLEGAGRRLKSFVAFTTQDGSAFITTERALQWATAPRDVQPLCWAARLGAVRRFRATAGETDPGPAAPPTFPCRPSAAT